MKGSKRNHAGGRFSHWRSEAVTASSPINKRSPAVTVLLGARPSVDAGRLGMRPVTLRSHLTEGSTARRAPSVDADAPGDGSEVGLLKVEPAAR